MTSVTFSVPVSTGTSNVTTADVVKNGGNWPTHSSADATNSLALTLTRIVGNIPAASTQTNGASDISGGTSTASTRAVDVKNYVESKIDDLVDSAPDALNTLKELATSLGDDTNFAGTVTTALGNKAAKNGTSSEVFATSTLSATAIREHNDGDGFTIGKNASVANGETWIEIDSSNHVVIKGKNSSGTETTLVTFAA